ncbi:dsDNA nuclease domain-containing protein [Pararoseomonas indoligenes]|uniref:DUF4297 domain-containing protein n=1 Tax=Roseomonas indoligenes TaxID=2820811 RepID=A0A940N614_9PROT|nr:dsDNA nuclease domain-containing protein [Pararoseomonas indoligenes]MBP0495755.1 DUF4297 domain-containing protein [Pararoseomonas indoligenes]
MTIINDLLSAPERENGGRTALDRFDFQTAWGIANVLRLHDNASNYAVAFEFHDDIVELDDADNPNAATFYQVKTLQTGKWTFADILFREAKGKGINKTLKASYVGRMFDNVSRFGHSVSKLVLVSNQPLPELTEEFGERAFSSATKDLVDKFKVTLQKECVNFNDQLHMKYFYFDRCRLDLGSYEDTLTGKMAGFLNRHSAPEAAASAFTIYLANEGRKRSKSLSDVQDFAALKASKFLTSHQMTGWLNRLTHEYTHHPSWETISRQLNFPHAEDVKIEREWRSYLPERMRRWNAATMQFTSEVKRAVEPVLDAAENLASGLSSAVPLVEDLVKGWKPNASDYLVKAIILYEYKK